MQRTMQMAAKAWKEVNQSHGELMAFNVNKPFDSSEAAQAKFNEDRKAAHDRYAAALEQMDGVMKAIERDEDKSYDLAAIPIMHDALTQIRSEASEPEGTPCTTAPTIQKIAKDALDTGKPNSSFPYIVQIMRERQRHIESGRTPDKDKQHYQGNDNTLCRAAACFALGRFAVLYDAKANENLWPQHWTKRMLQSKDRREQLVIAAALILAELERTA